MVGVSLADLAVALRLAADDGSEESERGAGGGGSPLELDAALGSLVVVGEEGVAASEMGQRLQFLVSVGPDEGSHELYFLPHPASGSESDGPGAVPVADGGQLEAIPPTLRTVVRWHHCKEKQVHTGSWPISACLRLGASAERR